MNSNKNMKKRAETDHRRILDKNKDFYNELLENNFSEIETNTIQAKPRREWRKLSVVVSSILLMVITSILLGVFLRGPDNHDGYDKTKNYLDENTKSRVITITEMQENLGNVVLHLNTENIKNMLLFYDSISNDHLYMKVQGSNEESFEDWTIFIEVNEYFKLPYLDSKYETEFNLNEHTLKYYCEKVVEDEIYFITTNAYMEIEGKKMHIKYECVAFSEEENTFFDWIKTSISF